MLEGGARGEVGGFFPEERENKGMGGMGVALKTIFKFSCSRACFVLFQSQGNTAHARFQKLWAVSQRLRQSLCGAGADLSRRIILFALARHVARVPQTANCSVWPTAQSLPVVKGCLDYVDTTFTA